jgi:hypothetical protein
VATDKYKKELDERLQWLESGLGRVSLGLGAINLKNMKPKSVIANTIDVSTLQSVQTNTGDLSVTGTLTMTTNGVFKAGKTAWNTGTGWWMDYNGGTPRFSIGNSSTANLSWDGSALTISGSVSATTGTIGGWTITATELQSNGGAGKYVGMSSAGGTVPAFFAGYDNVSHADDKFKVTQAGDITAVSGTIAGWTFAAPVAGVAEFKSGSGGNTVGLRSGLSGTNITIYAGSATPSSAPFRVAANGDLFASSATISGSITATAVSAATGSLSTLNIDGVMTISSTGAIKTSGGSYGATGVYMDFNASSPRFSLGSGITFSGTTLSVNRITATDGSIGGWTITSTTISGGSVTIDSGGIIYSGTKSTYASTTAGFWIGYDSGTPKLNLGASAAYLKWDGSALTIRGQLNWGSSGQHYVDSSTMHFDVPASGATSSIEWRNGAGSTYYTIATHNRTATKNQLVVFSYGSDTTRYGAVRIQGGNSTDDNSAQITSANSSGTECSVLASELLGIYIDNGRTGTGGGAQIVNRLGGTGGDEKWKVLNSSSGVLFQINSAGAAYFKSTAGGTELTVPIHTGVTCSGALPSPTKFMKVYDESGGTAYYIPIFTSYNAWAA